MVANVNRCSLSCLYDREGTGPLSPNTASDIVVVVQRWRKACVCGGGFASGEGLRGDHILGFLVALSFLR